MDVCVHLYCNCGPAATSLAEAVQHLVVIAHCLSIIAIYLYINISNIVFLPLVLSVVVSLHLQRLETYNSCSTRLYIYSQFHTGSVGNHGPLLYPLGCMCA